MLEKLGYDKNVKPVYNANRLSGLWLIIIGSVIIVATIAGGSFELNPFIFMAGFGIGFYLTNYNKTIVSKFMDGELSKFQKKMANIGVLSLFPMIFVLGGSFIPSGDWRMVWLGALLATGIHFLPFYFSHGKSMISLAIICTVVAVAGMISRDIPFIYFGIADGFVKISFGVYLLFFQKRKQ